MKNTKKYTLSVNNFKEKEYYEFKFKSEGALLIAAIDKTSNNNGYFAVFNTDQQGLVSEYFQGRKESILDELNNFSLENGFDVLGIIITETEQEMGEIIEIMTLEND